MKAVTGWQGSLLWAGTAALGSFLLASAPVSAADRSSEYPSYVCPYERFAENAPAVVDRNLTEGPAYGTLGLFQNMTNGQAPAAAGPLFSDIEVDLMYGRAFVEEKVLDSSGHDQEIAAFLSSKLGERWTLGLNVSHTRYTLGGQAFDLEQETEALDVLLAYDLTESWSVGGFVNVTEVDLEAELAGADDSFARYGAGLLAAFEHNLTETLVFGYTGGLASMNKQSYQRIFDDDDTTFINQVSLDYEALDSFFLKVQAAMVQLIDREEGHANPEENDLDGSYYILGAGAEYRITKSLGLEVGYETTACDEDRNEDWVKASANYRF